MKRLFFRCSSYIGHAFEAKRSLVSLCKHRPLSRIAIMQIRAGLVRLTIVGLGALLARLPYVAYAATQTHSAWWFASHDASRLAEMKWCDRTHTRLVILNTGVAPAKAESMNRDCDTVLPAQVLWYSQHRRDLNGQLSICSARKDERTMYIECRAAALAPRHS